MKFIETEEGKFINLSQVKYIELQRYEATHRETGEKLRGDACIVHIETGIPVLLFLIEEDLWKDERITEYEKRLCLSLLIDEIFEDKEISIGNVKIRNIFNNILHNLLAELSNGD